MKCQKTKGAERGSVVTRMRALGLLWVMALSGCGAPATGHSLDPTGTANNAEFLSLERILESGHVVIGNAGRCERWTVGTDPELAERRILTRAYEETDTTLGMCRGYEHMPFWLTSHGVTLGSPSIQAECDAGGGIVGSVLCGGGTSWRISSRTVSKVELVFPVPGSEGTSNGARYLTWYMDANECESDRRTVRRGGCLD